MIDFVPLALTIDKKKKAPSSDIDPANRVNFDARQLMLNLSEGQLVGGVPIEQKNESQQHKKPAQHTKPLNSSASQTNLSANPFFDRIAVKKEKKTNVNRQSKPIKQLQSFSPSKTQTFEHKPRSNIISSKNLREASKSKEPTRTNFPNNLFNTIAIQGIPTRTKSSPPKSRTTILFSESSNMIR